MITLHPSEHRGTTKLSWLNGRHSFSFGRYQDPRYMGVGPLRVLNHDVIAGGGGFAPHPHGNMEIVTIPLRGRMTHQDDTGHTREIGPDDIQAMSAGSGIVHSEYNASDTEEAELLQVWIEPAKRDLQPSYADKTTGSDERQTGWSVIASKAPSTGLIINANATILRAELTAGESRSRPIGNLAYVYVIGGNARVNNLPLRQGDAAIIRNETELAVSADSALDVLVFDL